MHETYTPKHVKCNEVLVYYTFYVCCNSVFNLFIILTRIYKLVVYTIVSYLYDVCLKFELFGFLQHIRNSSAKNQHAIYSYRKCGKIDFNQTFSLALSAWFVFLLKNNPAVYLSHRWMHGFCFILWSYRSL